MKQQLRHTCSSCGKRRVKAKNANGRKVTKKLCQPCYDTDKVSVFFSSSAGDWFTKRAIEHCTNSIPQNTDGLIELINLYKRASSAKGWSYNDGKWSTEYDYEICHKDPRKGEDFTGALVAGNLFIGLKSINRAMGNHLPLTNFGYRIKEQGEPIPSSNARTIIKGLYSLDKVVDVCKLKRKSKSTPKDFQAYSSLPPEDLFVEILDGYGFNVDGYSIAPEYVEEGFQLLHDLPRLFAYSHLVQYGTRSDIADLF
jgi:hypothetical protein